MTILVAGASGATGKQLVEQLLKQNHNVKVIVRSPEKLPESWQNNDQLKIISASILELTNKALSEYTKDCQAIVSCLGHNMSWKGIYGHPRKLVTDATLRLCDAVKGNQPTSPVKYI